MRRAALPPTAAAAAALLLLAPGLLPTATPAAAQASRAELPARARAMDLTLALPRLDGLRFDSAAVTEGYQAYDLRWGARRGDFELRYRLVPEGAPGTQAPSVTAGALATHLARNGPDDYVGRFRAGTEDLERLGADWAYFWDYVPKPAWGGRYTHCYQVSYYREGRGLVHGWLLYDAEALRESDWPYALPFAAGE